MDVVRGNLEEEVAEEGLDAVSWSAVVNPKAKGRNKANFSEEKERYTFIVIVHYMRDKIWMQDGGFGPAATLVSCHCGPT